MYEVPIDLRWLESEIVAYEQQPIEKGKILFYGHSMLTRWGHPTWGYRRLDEDIRMRDGSLACVNHGFGTATSEELLYYYPRMVRPWEPRALVIMSFGNDGMYGMSVDQTLSNVFKICMWARADFPGIKIFLTEPHPKPKLADNKLPPQWHTDMHRNRYYCSEIDSYARNHEDTEVIRLWNRPEFFVSRDAVGDFQKVREDIFSDDKVHLNQAGYNIFGPIIREALGELL